MARPLLVSFVAGGTGPWLIKSVVAAIGPTLPISTRLAIVEGGDTPTPTGAWRLRGFTSNERYVERSEREQLVSTQETLGRAAATCAALIPIRKSEAWWDLTQDERRQVLEQRSAHIATGVEYLPAVARRLHHSRDLGEEFDFLTWFEYAPEHSGAFEDLVGRLRQTDEWTFVEREVDIRLTR
jgi:hypothetical protein